MITTNPAADTASKSSSRIDDVLAGLRDKPKHLPYRLLYDARGATLFEQICTVEDYYLTRSELSLLETHLPAIAETVGPDARVIEPGSGEGVKTRMLLASLERPLGYVPIDVSHEQLEQTARSMRGDFPGLEVQPCRGDYMRPLQLPRPSREPARTLVFFPGSTIGNFEPASAEKFLARLADIAGPNGMLLLGADSNTNARSLLRAYDDSDGVTAAFDLNVLAHVNRTHAATFDLDAFEHRAVWDPSRSRIEMHLVSRKRQIVKVAGTPIELERSEPIVTEHCYKHPPAAIAEMLASAGWRLVEMMPDARNRMHLWLATRV